jgi:peptide-methionine (R)-S-oxide reductase
MFNWLKKSAEEQKEETFAKHLEEIDTEATDWASKDKEYWKETLTPAQFHVTRQGGTERAFTGLYWDNSEKGTYCCSNCGQALFDSETKFDSGTGWPSYSDAVNSEAVTLKEDRNLAMTRTEALCSRCDAHLGHVFPDGPTPSGKRYCMNSLSLTLRPSKDD